MKATKKETHDRITVIGKDGAESVRITYGRSGIRLTARGMKGETTDALFNAARPRGNETYGEAAQRILENLNSVAFQ